MKVAWFAARVWRIFQPCFWAVAMAARRRAKVRAPAIVRKLPEIFHLDLHHPQILLDLIVGEGDGEVIELDPIRATTGGWIRANLACPVLQESSSFLLLLPLLWVYGQRVCVVQGSGISTALGAASILSIPACHTAIGIWLIMMAGR